MKTKLTLMFIIALPLMFSSCTPTEYHSVTVYEYRKPKPKPQAPKDDPRAFIPKEKF